MRYDNCQCGKKKDGRARRCATCSKKSFGVGRKTCYLEVGKVEEVVKASSSFLEVAERLGTTRSTATAFIQKHNLSIGHFRPARGRFYLQDEVLRKDSKVSRTCLKKTVLRLGLLEERCRCGLTDTWEGRTLVLELDHIDGDPTNNVIENLRFLCPNCHSQTETSKGKNKRGWRKHG